MGFINLFSCRTSRINKRNDNEIPNCDKNGGQTSIGGGFLAQFIAGISSKLFKKIFNKFICK